MLGGEHVGIEVGHPDTPSLSQVEEMGRIADHRLDPAPEERRVALSEVGRAVVAEPAIESSLGELVEKCV